VTFAAHPVLQARRTS